jgi:hypothetical protein
MAIKPIVIILIISLNIMAHAAYRSHYGNDEFKTRMEIFLGDEVENFDVFYTKILDALTHRKLCNISGLIKYPFRTEIKGKKVIIKNENQFCKQSKLILENNFIKLVLCEQDEIHQLSSGVMIGGGELWFRLKTVHGETSWKIIAINN